MGKPLKKRCREKVRKMMTEGDQNPLTYSQNGVRGGSRALALHPRKSTILDKNPKLLQTMRRERK